MSDGQFGRIRSRGAGQRQEPWVGVGQQSVTAHCFTPGPCLIPVSGSASTPANGEARKNLQCMTDRMIGQLPVFFPGACYLVNCAL